MSIFSLEKMNIHIFFNQLRFKEVAIWLSGPSTLKFSAPPGFQNQETDNFIVSNKTEIIRILSENKIFSKEEFLRKIILRDTLTVHHPLSSSQERLWFIEQYEDGTNAYHIPMHFDLRGMNVEGVKYALRQIVARHEVLRTTIHLGNDMRATQKVHDELLPIEEVSIKKEQHESLIAEEINRHFDLSQEYPLRAKIYSFKHKSSKQEALYNKMLLVNVHHIAFDGWSLAIFQRELEVYYKAFIKNDTAFLLPALSLQYKDYAAWQKNYLTGEILDHQVSYWKRKCFGFQTLALPTDYPRPSHVDYRGANEEFVIQEDVSRKLRHLGRSCGATLHSVLLSSISILLSKYSGQKDIVIGSAIANRHHHQTSDIIGIFINMQVNRALLNESQSFEDLILETQFEQIDAQLHQDLPFEKLVEQLGVERDTSRHPIFQVTFGMQDIERGVKINDGEEKYFRRSHERISYEVAKFDLSFTVEDSGQDLVVKINYATSLFKKETITRLIAHYTYLLEQLSEAPKKAYDEFVLLRADEYKTIVHDWNTTNKEYPKNKTICDLFEEQANRTPENISLAFNGQTLTYRELNERSNQLARHIRICYRKKTGYELKADTLIALCLDKNFEMIIAILAVLKAGGAYVPIAPSYPQDRVDYMINDTGTQLVLTRRYLNKGKVLRLPREKRLYVDLTEDFYKDQDTSNVERRGGASDLAYVIYTSGTTGKPKGVMVEHGMLLQFIFNFNNYLSENIDLENKNFLSLTNYVFDIFGLEYSLPLITGAKVILSSLFNVNKDEIRGSAIIQQTPGSLLQLVTTFSDQLSHCVCLVGGEALPPSIASKLVKSFRKVFNVYGPAESTIWSTAYVIENPSEIRIGRPLPNERVYVLDHKRAPVPIGVVGELFIGGAGVARGYLNDLSLTKNKFSSNHFATDLNIATEYARLYRTGDLVKWLAGGNLEFIGRSDHQVKIRGHRIELGEIEYVLSKIEGIKQVCVLARERRSPAGILSKYLVGYYARDIRYRSLTEDAIFKTLAATLPDYMMPELLVELEKFPLTINGKLDRRALPDVNFTSSDKEYEAPRSGLEASICKIWEETLGRERVGINDDFFKLGGNSILAIQVANRMRKALGVDIRVADVFRYKAVCKFSSSVKQEFSIIKPYKADTNSKFSELPNLIFLPPAGGGSETYQDLTELLATRFNCIGIDNYNISAKEKIYSLHALSQYYLMQYEKMYELNEPIFLLGYSLGGKIALEIAAILEKRHYKRIKVILLDTRLTRSNKRYSNLQERSLKRKMQVLRNGLLNLYEKNYVDEILSSLEPETSVGISPISGYLEHAEVLLFKTTQTKEMPAKYNNVELIAAKIAVTHLDCKHSDILKRKSRQIADYLFNDFKIQ